MIVISDKMRKIFAENFYNFMMGERKMTLDELKENITNIGYEDVVVFENPDYADACIGISHDNRAIYGFNKMVECLVRDDNMTEEDAVEFIEYNTVRALPYIENSPIILYNLEQ